MKFQMKAENRNHWKCNWYHITLPSRPRHPRVCFKSITWYIKCTTWRLFFCSASWLFRTTRCSFTTCLSSRGKLSGRVLSEIQFQHPPVSARINQSFYSSGLHAKTNRAAWTDCGWLVLWQIAPIFTRQVVPFLKAGCCWITGINILFTIKLVGGAVASWLARDSGASGPGSSPGRGHVLCSWERHFALTVPLSPRCINGYQRI